MARIKKTLKTFFYIYERSVDLPTLEEWKAELTFVAGYIEISHPSK